MNYIVEPFSVRLKKAMNRLNISVDYLSKRIDTNRSAIYAWLNGDYKAKQDKLILLADVLNVSEVWLMGYNVPLQKDLTPKNNISAEYGLLTNDTISVQGLDDDDIKEIKRQIEYLKNKNNNTQK